MKKDKERWWSWGVARCTWCDRMQMRHTTVHFRRLTASHQSGPRRSTLPREIKHNSPARPVLHTSRRREWIYLICHSGQQQSCVQLSTRCCGKAAQICKPRYFLFYVVVVVVSSVALRKFPQIHSVK